MGPALLAASFILEHLPQITVGVEHLFGFVSSVRTAAQQTSEWSDEMEAAYQKRLLAKADLPQSQPDPR